MFSRVMPAIVFPHVGFSFAGMIARLGASVRVRIPTADPKAQRRARSAATGSLLPIFSLLCHGGSFPILSPQSAARLPRNPLHALHASLPFVVLSSPRRHCHRHCSRSLLAG